MFLRRTAALCVARAAELERWQRLNRRRGPAPYLVERPDRWTVEREVMRLARLGFTNGEIGAKVGRHKDSVSRIIRRALASAEHLAAHRAARRGEASPTPVSVDLRRSPAGQLRPTKEKPHVEAPSGPGDTRPGRLLAGRARRAIRRDL